MKKLQSIEDERQGVVRYELSDGRIVCFDRRAVQDVGVAELLRRSGLESDTNGPRVNVVQHGRVVGSVPTDFDPDFIKSQSFFYDPRPGDFVRADDVWVASNTLGPGDLRSVPGFRLERESQT